MKHVLYIILGVVLLGLVIVLSGGRCRQNFRHVGHVGRMSRSSGQDACSAAAGYSQNFMQNCHAYQQICGFPDTQTIVSSIMASDGNTDQADSDMYEDLMAVQSSKSNCGQV